MPERGLDSRTDLDLVAAANSGDVRAFEALYERYRDWVVGVANRFTRDRDLSLDVMQEVFTYLLSRFPGFELRAEMKTFLYPAIRHTAVAMAQRRRRIALVGDAADDAIEGRPSAAGMTGVPAGTAGAGGRVPLRAALVRALDELPPAHREVLILRFADELPLASIATALGVPLGTVKSRLHNALQAMRAVPELGDLFSP